MNYWISRFVAEVQNRKGEPYPPRYIHQLLAGLQQYILDKNPNFPKLLDKQQTCFRDIRGTCDTVYRDLRSQGIGAKVRHAPIITPDEEEKLWLTEVFNINNPKALQRAVFYYNEKCFCIRGGQEQRSLAPSNFKWSAKPGCDLHSVTYIEHGSKNRPGGLSDMWVENKEVTCHAVTEEIPKCLVFLLNKYLAKLPKYAFEQDNILYLRPKATTPADLSLPWYEEAVVGKNTLSAMVKEMCAEAGIGGKTNHSLHATGASAMFQANVPKKIIQKTTGHRSIEALRSYERASTEQQKAVSRVLMSNTSFYSENQCEQCELRQQNVKVITHTNAAADNIGRLFGDLTNCKHQSNNHI